ncbi:hypothetical protein PVAP13_6KG155300 [Panicum virgatum]|uniref:Enhancer of polycomb-like protein n=1 Tax=Panicum virgatum TaxID=38727 RepID=A0A8T0RCM8_PANVG|nr:hypothetical protein PVAP13_6KG155300 [Panicum virgatum]
MPAAGARRSTRVFMPKAPKPLQAQDQADPATRVLRSGKRLAADRIRWDAKEAAAAAAFNVDVDHDQQHLKEDSPKPVLPPLTKSFGIVYTRKRRRRRHPAAEVLAENEDGSRRFGIVYSRRKGKRLKVAPLQLPQGPDASSDLSAAIPCSSQEFASRTGFLDAHFTAFVDGSAAQSGALTLVVLVDTSCSRSSHRFQGLLLPVLRWMRRSRQRDKVRNLVTFILSAGVAAAFASQGVHFVKLQRLRASALLHRPLLQCGWCALYGAKKSEPLVSIVFSALPSYFWSLHSSVALDSMYLPAVIRESSPLSGVAEGIYTHTPLYVDSGAQSTGIAKLTSIGSDEPFRVVSDYLPLEQVAGLVGHGLKLKKHQRKRRSMRHPRSRRRLSSRLPGNAIGMKQSTVAIHTEVKMPSNSQEPPVEPVHPKAALEISLDLLENMDESDVSTPMGSTRRKRSSLKSPVDRMNERLALAEVRQNIDSVHSKANLLIIQADRCWREEGAEVMLELSDTNKWCIVVKIQGVTRYSLKPSDLRSHVVNRHTQAYIWAIDDAWKLEFTDKWDWLLFKELHVVGRERNSQGKPIPIPGVHEVSDDMEGIVADPFSRPVDYIRMVDDEVARALSRDSIYDMDSEDERWLIQLSHAYSNQNSSQRKHTSYEDFEMIISIFEKDAYNNPKGIIDLGELISRYPALGKDDNVHAVYEYWTNKRSKRAAPLLRIFQGAPLRRGHLSQKSAMKRKRSFKRQRSQAGRGKPETLLQESCAS